MVRRTGDRKRDFNKVLKDLTGYESIEDAREANADYLLLEVLINDLEQCVYKFADARGLIIEGGGCYGRNYIQ